MKVLRGGGAFQKAPPAAERQLVKHLVSLDDISRVARRLLAPEDLEVVVVGKPENLEATN